MAQVCRVPFGEVSGDRLQQLSSLKNRQNGIVHAVSDAKSVHSPSAGKRSYDTSMLEFDSENIDPAVNAGSKKSKPGLDKTLLFSPSLVTPAKSALFTSTTPRQTQSERSRITRAPAGRSPKRQPRSLFNKSFKRIEPPFATSSSLPFSLDAALSSTVAPTRKARVAMPDFKIYEDTAEEEAATVMEHSTLTLDLSSDDESAVNVKSDRGKENTPPEDYVQPMARPRVDQIDSNEAEKMVEDCSPRTPLTELVEDEVPIAQDVLISNESKTIEPESTETGRQSTDAADAISMPPPPAPKASTFSFTLSTLLDLPTKEHPSEDVVIFEDTTAQETSACR